MRCYSPSEIFSTLNPWPQLAGETRNLVESRRDCVCGAVTWCCGLGVYDIAASVCILAQTIQITIEYLHMNVVLPDFETINVKLTVVHPSTSSIPGRNGPT